MKVNKYQHMTLLFIVAIVCIALVNQGQNEEQRWMGYIGASVAVLLLYLQGLKGDKKGD